MLLPLALRTSLPLACCARLLQLPLLALCACLLQQAAPKGQPPTLLLLLLQENAGWQGRQSVQCHLWCGCVGCLVRLD